MIIFGCLNFLIFIQSYSTIFSTYCLWSIFRVVQINAFSSEWLFNSWWKLLYSFFSYLYFLVFYILYNRRDKWICSVQSLSCVWLFATLWTAACQASMSITNSQSLPKLMSIESVMPSNHLILCRPLLPLPPILPSIRVFSNESVLHIRWPKYWSFSFNISPSNEHPELISFRIGLVGSPCSPRDSQESSPTPQFKSINSLALSFLYSSTLTSIYDHWKNHSLD